VVALAIVNVFPDTISFLPEIFGKDTSLSNRTYLWDYMLIEISDHPLHGVGFQGYWIVSRLKYSKIYDLFIWLPNQAHNGYLDIINEVGIIGILLMVLMVIFYFINFKKVKKPHLWALFIIIPLITNMSESSFFRMGKEMNFIFIFSYIYLFYSLLQQKEQDSSMESRPLRTRYKK
jgi:O-antigen ligase